MNWTMVRDGEQWRRAVASPFPRRIRQMSTIKLLLQGGVIAICAGGGGIPVTIDAAGTLRGVEAVIDKDLAAAVLAEGLGAEWLLLLTDVAGVWPSWPAVEGAPMRAATPAQLGRFQFAQGSMGPKVDAACRFVQRTGQRAGIGAIDQAEAILEGQAGTVVHPS